MASSRRPRSVSQLPPATCPARPTRARLPSPGWGRRTRCVSSSRTARSRSSRSGTPPSSATWPPTPAPPSRPVRSPARRVRSSPPVTWASTRSARTAWWFSATRRCSTPPTSTSSTSELVLPAAAGRHEAGGGGEHAERTPDRAPRLFHPPGPAGHARRVPGPARRRLAGDAARSAGRRLARLPALPARGRAARGDRRDRRRCRRAGRRTVGHGRHRGERPLGGRDGPFFDLPGGDDGRAKHELDLVFDLDAQLTDLPSPPTQTTTP